MAAAALGAIAPSLVGPAKEKASEELKKLKEDPVDYVTSGFIKLGTLLTMAGALMWLASGPLLDMSNRARWDMQDALGVPRDAPPAPPSPPPPPAPAVAGFSAVALDLSTIDPYNAANAANALQQANTDWLKLKAILNAGGTQSIPPDASGPLTNVQSDIGLAFSAITATPNDWTTTKTNIVASHNDMNALADALKLPRPFITPPSPSAPTDPWSGFVSTVVNPFVSAIEQVGGDIASGISTMIKDFSAIGADIGTGLAILGKFVMNFPRVTWDGLVFAFTWASGTLFGVLGPWLLGIGLVFMVGGMVFRFAYTVYADRLKIRAVLWVNARGAAFWNKFDKRFRTRAKIQSVWTQKSTEAMIHSANANPRYVPPVELESNTPPTAEELKKVPGGPESRPPEGPSSPPDDSGEGMTLPPPPPPPDAPPGPAKEPPPPPEEKPLPVGTPTSEVERQLGEPEAIEPTSEELREMEKNRIASMAKEDAAVATANEEALANMTSVSDAEAIIDEKTKVIKDAQSVRRAATFGANKMASYGRRRNYRGFMEGAAQEQTRELQEGEEIREQRMEEEEKREPTAEELLAVAASFD